MAIDRRTFLQLGALGLSGAALRGGLAQDAGKTPTRFQVGCTTLPYAPFSLDRALQGIRSAGFKYVALYTTHKEDGKAVPVIAPDDPVEKAKEVGRRCRDQGLEPAFMFSGIYPEAKDGLEVLTRRLQQASAANIAQVLTFGHTKGGNRALWVERFRKLGPIARDLGVLLVVKQHGGETGTGAACAEITREVADGGIKVNFDAGNVLDYLNVDPIPDLKACADEVRSFCIKDHRNFPKSQDCGPGLGEIDHYKLLHVVMSTG
ncbi:MAG TPA: sugar phosphate isomerase/epimerase, partial [Planctomycetota bacterium]|nr:sugar phosphate isomerase/epimerase [Planctomycetota bacterium]